MDTSDHENSVNSDEDDFTEERTLPNEPSTSGFFKPQKNIIECRDQFILKKNYHAYFVHIKRESRDLDSQHLENCGKLSNFKNVQKRIVEQFRKEQQYHCALPIEDEFKASLGRITRH